MRSDLRQLNRTIGLLEGLLVEFAHLYPEPEPKRHSGLQRYLYAALKEANGPLTTQRLREGWALESMALHGESPGRKAVWYGLHKLADKGLIRKVEKDGRYFTWELVR